MNKKTLIFLHIFDMIDICSHGREEKRYQLMKLRKMLGENDWEECREMMSIIETQSKETLALWGLSYVKENYMPILRKIKNNTKMEELIEICERTIRENKDWKEVKGLLKEKRQMASTIKNPIAQAAVKAISVACAIFQTPTNALGFIYYGAATKAYDGLGIDKTVQEYEIAAKEEWKKALKSLRDIAIENEKNPVKVKWNC